MKRHPTPSVVADYLRRVADMLDEHGQAATERARLFAARGWPASVNGDGRGGADSSSTERAALNPGPLAGLDESLATHIRLAWYAATQCEADMIRILTHASDDDPTPPGTGSCERCGEFCRPTAARPHNRIRSGYCPTCRRAWHRAGRPDRFTFNRSGETAA